MRAIPPTSMIRRLAISAAALCACILSGCGPRSEAAARPLSLEIQPQPGDGGRAAVVLRGSAVEALRRTDRDGQGERLLYLAVKRAPTAAGPVPVLATRTYRDGECVLAPQVPLTRGLTYEAVFEGPGLDPHLPRLTAEYTLPADHTPSDSTVTAVYPAQAEVPANLLKFYVHFRRPMGEGRVFEFARLLDADGKPVRKAFHEIELWSEDHRRLTLLINPGRTKRALGLSEWLGPVLRERRRCTLELEAGLPDRHGRPLAKAFRHPFRTGSFDRRPPRIAAWRVTPPAAGSRAPLAVEFDEPLDHALGEQALRVLDPGGAPAPGTAALDEASRRWTLTPEAPWTRGEYTLEAEGELEDLAGNSLLRPFETDAGHGARPAVKAPEFRRAFRME